MAKRNRRMLAAVIAVVSILLAPTVAGAQTAAAAPSDSVKVSSVRDAFKSLDIPALEILRTTTRLDMLDYWDADSIYKATNAMNGLSWIEKCSPGYMKVQLTPVSRLELKLFPTKKNGNVTMAVYTVGGDSQAEDSEVMFFSDDLKPLDAKKFFKAPDLKEFFEIPKGSLTTMKEIREMIPFPTVAYSASPDSSDLTARLTVEKFMNVDDYNIIKLFLKPEITVRVKVK